MTEYIVSNYHEAEYRVFSSIDATNKYIIECMENTEAVKEDFYIYECEKAYNIHSLTINWQLNRNVV